MLKSLLQFEPVLVRLCNNKQWDEASRRAHSHPSEAVPSPQAHRSSTALSAAVRGGAPLDTVVSILEACPEQLLVCHLRRGSVLHDAILHNKHKHNNHQLVKSSFEVLRFLVTQTTELMLKMTSTDKYTANAQSECCGDDNDNPFAMFDCLGRRPLHLIVSKAYMGMDMNLISMLVKANPGAAACRDGDAQTPLTTALSVTTEVGNMEIEMRVLEVTKLLLRAFPAAATQGICSDRSASLMTPLWCAIYYGRFSRTIKLLLDANPDAVQDICMNHEVCLNLCVTTRVPLDTIRMILAAYPQAVLTKDNYSLTPLCWAWIRHISPSRRSSMRLFIPSQFPNLLEDAINDLANVEICTSTGEVLGCANQERLDYFWSKSQMLLCASHHFDTLDNVLNSNSKIQWRALHAASALCCPSPFFSLSYKFHPEQARQRDESGKFPLHHAAARASYRRQIPIGATSLRTLELTDHVSPLSVLLGDYPEGATVADNEGRLPLHIWVECRCNADEGTNCDFDVRLHELDLLIEANSNALERRDMKTRVYPFMLALIGQGEVFLSSVNYAFLMLKRNPSLIKLER